MAMQGFASFGCSKLPNPLSKSAVSSFGCEVCQQSSTGPSSKQVAFADFLTVMNLREGSYMTQNRSVSFLDLAAIHQELEAELVPVFQKAIRSAGFIGGPMVEGFEAEFARFCDAKYCIGVNSGTDALRFAL